jgi:hypothetical protein
LSSENKVHSVAFVSQPPSERIDICDRYIWAGLEKGSELVEVDSVSGEMVSKSTSHTAVVTHILRGSNCMYTIDDNGGLRIWKADPQTGMIGFTQRPQALRVQGKISNAILAGSMSLWTSQGKFIEVYTLKEDAVQLLDCKIDTSSGFTIPSNISALAYDSNTQKVYCAHESGKISEYSAELNERLKVIQASSYKITSMTVIAGRIWVGLQTGKILIFQAGEGGWICILDFLAYPSQAVTGITYDDRSLLAGMPQIAVVSVSDSGHMKIWDGLLRSYFMDRHVRARQDEYAIYTPLSLSMLTYNIDSRKPSDMFEPILEAFVAQNDADIFVFGFQELVDLENVSLLSYDL